MWGTPAINVVVTAEHRPIEKTRRAAFSARQGRPGLRLPVPSSAESILSRDFGMRKSFIGFSITCKKCGAGRRKGISRALATTLTVELRERRPNESKRFLNH
jgi:hypothetical protein